MLLLHYYVSVYELDQRSNEQYFGSERQHDLEEMSQFLNIYNFDDTQLGDWFWQTKDHN